MRTTKTLSVTLPPEMLSRADALVLKENVLHIFSISYVPRGDLRLLCKPC